MILFDQNTALFLVFALLLDAVLGDPDWLCRRVSHPVALIGRLIGWLERGLNRSQGERGKRIAGVVALLLLLGTTGAIATALSLLFALHPFGLAVQTVLVAVLLAQRSLFDHVRRVRDAFHRSGLPAARQAVSLIVGRDPEALDEAGVCRAAIETTAENFSDGVVAPAFWYLIAGLPGILIYKAVNTADSMIGHRTPRHEAFGWAAARLDDVLNIVPARLSGLIFVVASVLIGADGSGAWRAMWRDAGRHRSPNAGWPEAAMGGALGLALAGPRQYASGPVDDVWMNADGNPAVQPEDITRALRLFAAACTVQIVLVVGSAAALA